MSFDYERAWRELAKPAYEALPANLRDLYVRVGEECSEFAQAERTLDLPWPEEPMVDPAKPNQLWRYDARLLRSVFANTPAEFLAEAAHIIYFYGHWSPDPAISRSGAGAYWRFANYADQDLCHRTQIPRRNEPPGSSFRIHQGFLRACWSDDDQWMWEEIGLGTVETLTRATDVSRPSLQRHIGRKNQIENQADLQRWFDELKEACLPKDGGFIPKFFDLSEYGG